MKRQRTIYFKSFFLLIVFSMNTMVSFACSTSDFFHNSHHSQRSGAKSSIRLQEEMRHNHHKHGSHSHDPDDKQHNNDSDNCCSSSIITLAKIEKSIARSIEIPIPSIMPFTRAFIFLVPTWTDTGKTLFPDLPRWRPLTTIQDLRIVIQSFQI